MNDDSRDLAVRLSDDERARAVHRLDDAVAAGRITWAEHAERSDRAWAARTRGELVPCLADLGVERAPAQRVVAVGSKIVRVPESCREIEARAVFGAVVLDLSSMGPGERVLLRASSFCGKIVLMVAEDAMVVDEGSAVLGKRTILGGTAESGGPVIRVSGRSVLGHLKVYRGERGQPSHPFHGVPVHREP